MSSSTCQRCKQPVRANSSLLAQSSFDLLASHLSPESASAHHHPSSQYHRLPPSLQAAYGLPPARPASPLSRKVISRPSAASGPAESFVLLTESQVRPSPSASTSSVAPPANDAAVPKDKSALLSHHQDVSTNIYNLLSKRTAVDHPLCSDCADILQEAMSKQLEQVKRDRERYLAFERELSNVKVDPEEGEKLQKHIEKLKKEEAAATKALRSAAEELQDLQTQLKDLDAEEEELEGEEVQFWADHARYILELQSLQTKSDTFKARYEHDSRELEKLQKTNVYYDAFCIGHEGGLATINGLRLGRLPNVQVEWPEINAAWGHTMLLVHTIARKWDYTFDTYRLIPMASTSRIERLADKYTMELYGSGDFAFGRYLQNRRFDLAMVALLDCIKQIMEVATKREPGLRLPFSVSKDKIGDVSIKLQFSSDETWTRALRHVLLTLKMLLAKLE